MNSNGSYTLGDERMLFQVVPEDVKKMWNEQAVRGLTLASLALQIILILLGHLRKNHPRTLIRTTLWFVYFLAFSVVPIALSITAQSALEVCNNTTPHSASKHQKSNTRELMSFWASFLLLHLGGPNSITAYSSEDNELWLRHLVFLVFQSGVALYILLLSWPGCSHLPLLSIFVFASGCIKCFQRVRALRLGNTEHLRESMLGPADPGPDYVKILEEFQLKKSQGFNMTLEEVAEPPLPVIHASLDSEGKEILEAYDLFQTFKRLFVDLILTYEDRDRSTSYFRRLDSAREAFRAVEIEIGFAYDKLYTKATVVYTYTGFVLHATSAFLILLVLLGFVFYSEMGNFRVVDVAITCLLMAAEGLKEIFTLITMLRSDWTDIWLNQQNRTRNILIFPFLTQPSKQRWSNSIAQSDLLSVALREKPASFLPVQKLFGVDKYLETQRYQTYTDVSDNLKDMIYTQFCDLMACGCNSKGLCVHNGGFSSFSLRKNKCTDLLWSIKEAEFHQIVLIWHIATTLCYYSDVNLNDPLEINRIESKHISEYLVNLLISNPEMLPMGMGMIRYRDTCADAMRFFETKGPITGKIEACRKLLQVDCKELSPSVVKGDRSKSVLFDGCRLALDLKEMERGPMWEVVSQVWIEILAYAAANCRGVQHSQQLGRGGEFLTHVWLLMAHLGMTQHFQVSQGHARARFDVS